MYVLPRWREHCIIRYFWEILSYNPNCGFFFTQLWYTPICSISETWGSGCLQHSSCHEHVSYLSQAFRLLSVESPGWVDNRNSKPSPLPETSKVVPSSFGGFIVIPSVVICHLIPIFFALPNFRVSYIFVFLHCTIHGLLLPTFLLPMSFLYRSYLKWRTIQLPLSKHYWTKWNLCSVQLWKVPQLFSSPNPNKSH